MSAPRGAALPRRPALVLAVLLIAAACVHYPAIEDIGGTRITPEKGRAVRSAAGADFYVTLNSTGKYGDTLLGVSTPVARRAQVVAGDGDPLEALSVPGAAVMLLGP
ncbi:MAG: hypothetical protein ACREJG_07860, partial [Candidatus Rokuibacteriota bacterium]